MTAAGPAVVIAGGGMAGLMLAARLASGGRRCQVLERTAAIREVGAGVQLEPGSVHLLDRLGAGGDVRRRAVSIVRRELRDADGRLLSVAEPGPDHLSVHRADLHRALLSVVPSGTVRLATPVCRVTGDPAHPALDVAGRELRPGVLIGADGIRSTVRALLTRDRPEHSGFAAYRSTVPVRDLPAYAMEPVVRIWSGPGRHVVTYPIRSGALLNLVAVVPSLGGAEDWNAAADPADVEASFLGWDPRLTTVLQRIEACTWWALHDRPPLADLARGRVALIGDAAHPMLPFAAQGVNQAFADAAALSQVLLPLTDRAIDPSLPAGLELAHRLHRFSRQRAGRAAHAQAVSRRVGEALHHTGGH